MLEVAWTCVTTYSLNLVPIVQSQPEGYYYRIVIGSIINNDGTGIIDGKEQGLITTDNFSSDAPRRIGELSKSFLALTFPKVGSDYLTATTTAVLTGPKQLGWTVDQPYCLGKRDQTDVSPSYERFRPTGEQDVFAVDSFWDVNALLTAIDVLCPITLHVDDPNYLQASVAVYLAVTAFRFKDGGLQRPPRASVSPASSVSDLSDIFTDMEII
jgi:hypothetical protein